MSRQGLQGQRRIVLLAAGAALTLLLIAIASVQLLDRRAAVAHGGALREPLRIEIERDGFATIALQRSSPSGDWRIDAPCSLAVNGPRLTPLLDALNSASARYPVAEVDLAGAGLQSPAASLVLDGVRLSIGGPDLGGERRYLRAGDTVELVPEWILSLVQGGMTALATPAVFERPVVAVEDATGRSLAAEPTAWSALEAMQTVDWPLTDMPPIASRRALSVRFGDGSTQALELVRSSRWIALVDGACARLLTPDALPAID